MTTIDPSPPNTPSTVRLERLSEMSLARPLDAKYLRSDSYRMAGNGIVSEVLNCRIRDDYVDFTNYEKWRIQVKTYLLGQDLWDVVKPTAKGVKIKRLNKKIWRKKNAAALHAIQISCGANAFSLVKDIHRAKVAWATLEHKNITQEEQRRTTEHEQINQEREIESQSSGEESEGSPKDYDDEFQQNRLFFDAVISGNWNKSEGFIRQNKDVMKARIPSSGKNALHVAISAGHVHIAKELINLMTKDELEVRRKDDLTVLHSAVETGNVEIARCLVNKNKKLTILCSPMDEIERHAKEITEFYHRDTIKITKFTYSPVLQAVIYGQTNMAHYLYSVTSKEFLQKEGDGVQGSALITQCIYKKYFDIALDLLERCPCLAFIKDDFNRNPLYELANTKQVFRGGCRLGFWQKLLYDCVSIPAAPVKNDHVSVDIKNLDCNKKDVTTISVLGRLQRMASNLNILDIHHIYEIKLAHVRCLKLLSFMSQEIKKMNEREIRDARVHDAVAKAAYNGSVEFITEIARANPELVWTRELARRVFSYAIERRQAKVFSLIYGLNDKEALAGFVKSRTTILHLAGRMVGPEVLNLIPGPALQMQRALQWFKEVETLVSHATEYEDEKRRKPRELFTDHHIDLVSAGEKWMKDTSQSCTVVTTLIVTIMFTAAFTVPGGNHQDTGFPIFSKEILFKIFMISDVISLFTSTTSVLMFLGILTSRYAEDDFLKSLPNKLIIGLSTLFLSIATMMIAFSAAISIMFHKQLWIIIPIIFLACVPVLLFIRIQFSPLLQMIMSTYGPSIFDRKVKNWLYVVT